MSEVDATEKGLVLIAGATTCDLAAVNQVLAQGVDVNFQTTVCSLDIPHNNCVLSQLMPSFSVDTLVVQKGKWTALVKAARMKDVAIVRTLLNAGADVNRGSLNGWTPLIESCRVGALPVAELLLEQKGIEIDKSNST